MSERVVRANTAELVYPMENAIPPRSLQCSLGGGGVFANEGNLWALELLIEYRKREALRIQNLREGAFLP